MNAAFRCAARRLRRAVLVLSSVLVLFTWGGGPAPAQQGETLPPDVQFDVWRLELFAAARDGRHKDVLVTTEKLRKTGRPLPDEADFFEARAFHAVGSDALARDALVKYLKTVGRKGKDYDEALRLFVAIKEKQRAAAAHTEALARLKSELEEARKAFHDARADLEAWKKLAVVFGGPEDDAGAAMTFGTDGMLIVAGALHARKADDGKSIDATLPWITAFDAEGRRVWHRPLGGAVEPGRLRSAGVLPNGALVFGGVQRGYQFAAISDPLGNLAKNGEGDPWVIGFAPGNADDPGAIARVLPDGGIAAIGAAGIGKDAQTGNPLARLPVTVRLNLKGEVTAKAVLGDTRTPHWYTVNDAVAADNGDVVLAGVLQAGEGTAAGEPVAFVMRADATGKTLWQRRFSAASKGGIVLRALARLPAGGFTAAGHDGAEQLVLRLTESGDVIWRKALSGGTQGGGARLCAPNTARLFGDADAVPADFDIVRDFRCTRGALSASADAIIADGEGTVVIGHGADATSGTVNRIILTALRDDGGVVWRRDLGVGTASRARAALATADGGIVVAGTTAGWGRDVLIFKVDATGALAKFAALRPVRPPPTARPARKPPAPAAPEPEPTAPEQAAPRPAEPEPPAPAADSGAGSEAPANPAAQTSAPEAGEHAAAKPEEEGGTGPANAPPRAAPESPGGAEYDLIDLFDGLFGEGAPGAEPKARR